MPPIDRPAPPIGDPFGDAFALYLESLDLDETIDFFESHLAERGRLERLLGDQRKLVRVLGARLGYLILRDIPEGGFARRGIVYRPLRNPLNVERIKLSPIIDVPRKGGG
jgi:hypothetical protein